MHILRYIKNNYVLLFNCVCMCEWKDGPSKIHDVNVTWSPPRNEAFTLITYIVILACTFFLSKILRSCFVRFKFKISLKA